MSRNKEVKILKHGEVQKQIIAHPPKIRPKEHQLGPLNRYTDEDFEIYHRKKKHFLETCKKYNKLNQETLICCKKRLLDDYMDNLDIGFLIESDDDDEECASICPCENADFNKGRLIRKRTERPIHEVKEQPHDVCGIEPWFKRYLILNKFIWAARTIVLKNRLLRILEKLKTVTPEQVEELAKHQRKFSNVSYADIFERFL